MGVLGHTQAQPPPEGVAVPEGGNTRIGIGRDGSTRSYLGKVQSKENERKAVEREGERIKKTCIKNIS